MRVLIMASDIDDYDLDGGEIAGLDMDFDDVSMDAQEQPINRDPVTQLKTNLFNGAVTKATDANFIGDQVRKAVPKGYTAAYDEGSKQLDQINKAKRNLLSPIRREIPEFKRNLNRLSPMVKRLVGDRYGNKFDELTKVKAKGTDVDPDQAEMQAGLSRVFGAWRDNQLADREQDIADKLMSAQNEGERFKLQYTALNSISNAVNRQVGFQDSVLLGLHQQSLELDFKKYHILRNLLKVTTEGYNTSIGELKAITKNTGLPDIIKRQNSENFKQLFLDEWQGRATTNMVDFGKNYLGTMMDNLKKKATETGEEIANGLTSIGDMAGSFADMDEMQQEMGGPVEDGRTKALRIGASGVGGMVSGKIINTVSEMAKKYLDKNPAAVDGDRYLKYIMSNKEQLLDNYISERQDAAGVKGMLFGFLDSIRPTISADREVITHTLAEKATQEAQWDRISRETLIKIIPGWLSKIHLALKQLVTGDKNAEQETFDIYSESFVTKNQALKSLQDRLISDTSITDVREDVGKVVESLFKGNEELLTKLSQEQNDALEDAIIRSANNDIGTDLDKFKTEGRYTAIDGVSEEDAKVLADVMGTVLAGGSGVDSRKLGMIGAFNKLKETNPETQSTLNLLNATGQSQLLEGLGYGKRDASGKLNVDFNRLYDRKLGKYDGVGDSPTPAMFDSGIGDGFPPNPNPAVGGLQDELLNTLNKLTEAMNNTPRGSRQHDDLSNEYEEVSKTLRSIESLIIEDNLETLTNGKLVTLSDSSLDAIRDLTSTLRNINTNGGSNSTTSTDGTTDPYVSQLITANETLSDVRGVLTEMFAAQQANHNELMGRNGMADFVGRMGTKFSNLLKSPFKLITGGYNKAKEFAKKNLARAKSIGKTVIGMPIKFAKGIFGEVKAQIMVPDDVYVVGKTVAILLGKDMKSGAYYNRDAEGKVDNNKIKSIDDIQGEVINGETNTVAISLEDYQRGLETRTVGMSKRIGGLVAKAALGVGKLIGKGTGLVGSGFRKVGRGLGIAKDYVVKQLNKAKSLYDVEGKLLVSAKEIEEGALYILKNGKRVTVTSLADMKDTVYRYKDGEPIITVEQLKEGVRDKLGKLVKTKTLLSGLGDGAMKLAGMGAKLVKAPFKAMGKLAKSLMKVFEGKLVSSLLIHLPDNVIFKANIVYLMANEVRKGKPSMGNPNAGDPNSPSDDSSAMAKGKGKGLYSKFKVGSTDLLSKGLSIVTGKGIASEVTSAVSGKLAADEAKERALKAWKGISLKSLRGDGDGDGLRDGGWKEQLKAKGKSLLKGKDKQTTKEKEKDKEKGGFNFGILGSLLSGVVGKLIKGFGWVMGLGTAKDLLGNMLDGGTPDLDRNGKPKKTPKVRGRGKFGRAAGFLADKAKAGFGAVKNSKLVTGVVAKTAAKFATKRVVGAGLGVAAAGAGAAFGLTLLAPVVAVGLALWTAYEVGSGLWGYFDRRSDIGKLEYLRMLQYGYYVGDDDKYEDRKVALRYFEAEMIDRMEKNDSGGVGIEGSDEELWEEYSGDFDSTYGDEAARKQWLAWYNYRFKPVFFKWIATVGKLNARDDASYSITNLDDKLEKKDHKFFVESVMTFSELDNDPLEHMSSCFTYIGIQAKRSHIQKFIDEHILKVVEGKIIGADKAIASVSPISTRRGRRKPMTTSKTEGTPSKRNPRGGRKTKLAVSAAVANLHGNGDKSFDIRRRIILDTLEGDLTSKAKLIPLVDSVLSGILNGSPALSGPIKKKLATLIDVENKGKSAGEISSWVDNTLIPLVRDMAKVVGTTDGSFNEVDEDDYDSLRTLIGRYGDNSTGFMVRNGKLLTPDSASKVNITSNKGLVGVPSNKLQALLSNDKTTGGDGFPTSMVASNVIPILGHEATSSNVSDRTARNRALMNRTRKRFGRPQVNYAQTMRSNPPSRTTSTTGDHSNFVDIKPLSMGAPAGSSGTPAPHEITDKTEARIAQYDHLIHKVSQAKGVDEHLIRSVIRQESAGKPEAKSHVGASGLMQLMPTTAKELGVTNRWDPEQNITGGVEYIKRQLKRFDGIPELALAAYNAGGGNVNKTIRKAGTKDPQTVLNTLPQVTGRHSKETQEYVVKITNDYRKRVGMGGDGTYNKSGNAVQLTKLTSRTPEIAKINPTSRTNTNAPTGSISAPVQTGTNIPTIRDSGSDLIRMQHAATQRTRNAATQQTDTMNKSSGDILSVNFDQLSELRTLNTQMSKLNNFFTGEGSVPSVTKPSEESMLVNNSPKSGPKKRFERKVIETTPSISMDRKIS